SPWCDCKIPPLALDDMVPAPTVPGRLNPTRRPQRKRLMARDYYEVLGVQKNVDDKELKRAYRKLAMQLHPDRNPDDPEAEDRFKEASEAYEVLSDSEKRAVYDRFGHEGLKARGGGGRDVEDIFNHFSDLFGFGDLFGRGRGGRSGPSRGEHLRYDLEIDFEEAVFGTRITIDVPRSERCDRCDGEG